MRFILLAAMTLCLSSCGSAQQLAIPRTTDASAPEAAYLAGVVYKYLDQTYQPGNVTLRPLTRIAGSRLYRWSARLRSGGLCDYTVEGRVHADTEQVMSQGPQPGACR